jgi:hypothetical protein
VSVNSVVDVTFSVNPVHQNSAVTGTITTIRDFNWNCNYLSDGNLIKCPVSPYVSVVAVKLLASVGDLYLLVVKYVALDVSSRCCSCLH